MSWRVDDLPMSACWLSLTDVAASSFSFPTAAFKRRRAAASVKAGLRHLWGVSALIRPALHPAEWRRLQPISGPEAQQLADWCRRMLGELSGASRKRQTTSTRRLITTVSVSDDKTSNDWMTGPQHLFQNSLSRFIFICSSPVVAGV